jgi:hypothetical protein
LWNDVGFFFGMLPTCNSLTAVCLLALIAETCCDYYCSDGKKSSTCNRVPCAGVQCEANRVCVNYYCECTADCALDIRKAPPQVAVMPKPRIRRRPGHGSAPSQGLKWGPTGLPAEAMQPQPVFIGVAPTPLNIQQPGTYGQPEVQP